MIAPIEYKLLPEANASCGLAVLVTAWLPESSDVAQTEVFGFELHRHIPTALALQSASYPTGTRFIVAVQLLVWKNMTALGDRNYYNHKLLNPVGVVFTGIRQ